MVKILVVEDSKFFSDLICWRIARDLQIQTIPAASFAAARAAIAEHGDEIFLVLTDLMLPDAGGTEAVEYVRDRGFPTIIFTGSFNERQRDKIVELQVIDYVPKDSSSSLDYLVSLVRRIYHNQGKKALVVDDSPTARAFTASFLRRNLLTVLEAEDGLEAIDIIDQHRTADGNQISLVVTDYHMPNMDGFELIRNLRQDWRKEQIAIIGVSSTGNNLLSARFIKAGANDFISKPFLPEEFVCRISQNMDNLDLLAALRDAASKDYLTGMYNRRYFFHAAAPLFAVAKRQSSNLMVAMIDVDHFKSVNDNYGHDVGDEVLVKVAEVLGAGTRQTDIVARFGGEEYCLVAPNMSPDYAGDYLDKLRTEIAKLPFFADNRQFSITASIGATMTLGESLDDTIAIADRLLYEAKETGRNRVMMN